MTKFSVMNEANLPKKTELTKTEHAQLVALNMKRCIELIESIDWTYNYGNNNAELKAKMHEIRRDSISLEKAMYPDYIRH